MRNIVLKALEEKVETITKEIEDCTLQPAVDIIYIGRMENQYLNEKNLGMLSRRIKIKR